MCGAQCTQMVSRVYRIAASVHLFPRSFFFFSVFFLLALLVCCRIVGMAVAVVVVVVCRTLDWVLLGLDPYVVNVFNGEDVDDGRCAHTYSDGWHTYTLTHRYCGGRRMNAYVCVCRSIWMKTEPRYPFSGFIFCAFVWKRGLLHHTGWSEAAANYLFFFSSWFDCVHGLLLCLWCEPCLWSSERGTRNSECEGFACSKLFEHAKQRKPNRTPLYAFRRNDGLANVCMWAIVCLSVCGCLSVHRTLPHTTLLSFSTRFSLVSCCSIQQQMRLSIHTK